MPALRAWWDIIVEHGPRYGYFAKPSKTKLIVKAEKIDEARIIFEGTSIEAVSGWRDLGTAIGDTAFIRKYFGEMVADWTAQVEILARIANFTSHARRIKILWLCCAIVGHLHRIHQQHSVRYSSHWKLQFAINS